MKSSLTHKYQERPYKCLNDIFLDNRAKRVSDDKWLELSFEMVEISRVSPSTEAAHEKVLNDLIAQIIEIANIRTSSGHSTEVMAKIIATLRGMRVFLLVCLARSGQLQSFSSSLHEFALEADRALQKIAAESGHVSIDSK